MEQVLSRFPKETLAIEGRLRTRKRKGVDRQDLQVKMRLNLGGEPQSATYDVLSDKGAFLEGLGLVRRDRTNVTHSYRNADGSEEVPSLIAPIQATNVSWSDLTLSFLWWPGGVITGHDRVKGEDCIIVRLPSPSPDASRYEYVKVWIAGKYNVMLKAQGYAAGNALLREMEVKSFRKINDRWMIKDLDIRSMGSYHQTTLRIHDISVEEAQETEVQETESDSSGEPLNDHGIDHTSGMFTAHPASGLVRIRIQRRNCSVFSG